LKKFLIIILLLSSISCTTFIKNRVIDIPYSTPTIESSVTPTILPKVTATQHQIATATIEPSITITSLPELKVTQPVFYVIQKEYDPSEWKVLYDKSTVWQIDLGTKEQMWILTKDQAGYFNGKNWILYSDEDYGLPNSYNQMAVAPDGSAWVASPRAISHYQNGFWKVYPIPDASGNGYPCLAIDSSNMVRVSLWQCECVNSIRIFDGINWDYQRLWSIKQQVEVYQLLYTPDGTLWTSFYGSIGQYNGKTWKLYSGTDLWPKGNNGGIRIASDNQGNIFGINYDQEWIVRINKDGNISKIPFDYVNYEFFQLRMRIFIDTLGRLWTNACLKNRYQSCLAYYKDNKWISFRDLPFGDMTDIKELSDGSFLVATIGGLFQYNPEN
jgi:hypothetical protein